MEYNTYTLILCTVVFVVFTVLFSVMIGLIASLQFKLIKSGAEDETITKEYEKMMLTGRKSCLSVIIEKAITAIICVVVIVVFAVSMYLNLNANTVVGDIPLLKVVTSGSMANKYEYNEYLYDNHLDDQISTFDLILTRELPPEEELELYDIVVYEIDGNLVVHRIVQIVEPNADHPDERWFRLQGDAVEKPDRFPVKYSQMRAIYEGERVPFVGSFVYFMQSPAGWMCAILVAVVTIFSPIIDKKLDKAKRERLIAIGVITIPQETVSSHEDSEIVSESISLEEDIDYIDLEDTDCIEYDDEDIESSGLRIVRKDFRSLQEKLPSLFDYTQRYYASVCSYLRLKDGVRVRYTKNYVNFYIGKDKIARLYLRGKTICLMLALSPTDYEGSTYRYWDMSHRKTHSECPMMLRLTSYRQVEHAKILIDDMLNKISESL